MKRMSIEFIPRNMEVLKQELEAVFSEFSEFDTINVPDLLRFDVRSWEACVEAKKYCKTTVPHIRAIDIDMKKPLPMAEYLLDNGIREVLVLTGDPPQDFKRRIYPTTSVDLIRKFAKELPHIKVYAALDQYRSGIRTELEYCARKEDAGAVGFYTQPFFDERFLELYAEMMEPYEVFWGISPILSQNSFFYWEAKNRAIFPNTFEPTWECNVDVGQKIYDKVKSFDGNAYFMPIRTDVVKYLEAILKRD